MRGREMSMSSAKPPRKHSQDSREPSDFDETDDTAEIVAEDIEAGYDAQADAATKSLASDPASSSENETR